MTLIRDCKPPNPLRRRRNIRHALLVGSILAVNLGVALLVALVK